VGSFLLRTPSPGTVGHVCPALPGSQYACVLREGREPKRLQGYRIEHPGRGVLSRVRRQAAHGGPRAVASQSAVAMRQKHERTASAPNEPRGAKNRRSHRVTSMRVVPAGGCTKDPRDDVQKNLHAQPGRRLPFALQCLVIISLRDDGHPYCTTKRAGTSRRARGLWGKTSGVSSARRSLSGRQRRP
jgi:hypothetical protein